MKRGVKHENQFQIVHADFSGGLNTSASVDGIADNQLARAVNVEVDHATGKLKTVAGTVDVLDFPNLFAAAYDEINRKILLVDEDKRVYAYDLDANTISNALGILSGDLYPICASWEDGLLLASNGKLQYFNGTQLITLNSPTASSVCVQAGRILIADEKNLYLSGVGDETNWEENANVDSSAKFLEVGYKDGGEVIGMVNLSSGVLLIKNNRRAYRLNVGFPAWSLVEISSNTELSGRLSACAVADLVFVLGQSEVQNIQASNFYGNAKPQNISLLIESEIKNLQENSLLRYVPKKKSSLDFERRIGFGFRPRDAKLVQTAVQLKNFGRAHDWRRNFCNQARPRVETRRENFFGFGRGFDVEFSMQAAHKSLRLSFEKYDAFFHAARP